MAPKKKKAKKKKTKKVDTPRPLKSHYLARIAEMNAVLAQLRREIFQVEGVYLDAEKRYEQVQEDMADILDYLQHEIKVIDEEISGYDSEIDKYNKEMKKLQAYYEGIYAEMDKAYEEKKTILTDVIQSWTAKLNSYEEVRRQREEHLRRREALQKILLEMSFRHKEEMYEREKQLIIEQDTLQKEMERRLEELASDLREATDVSIGETTNRIIGENITLGNLLTCQQELFIKMRDNFTAMKKHQKDSALELELKEEEYNLIFERYSEGAAKIENLLQMVAETTGMIEDLKKLIKANRRLKRKIAELECYLKELASDIITSLKSQEETEELMAGPKGNMQIYQRNLIRLQSSLFDAAKKVKEAIDCENIVMEKEEIPQEEEKLVEIEEANKEKAYQKREDLIEEIVAKLQPRNLSIDELYQTASSIEFYETSYSQRSLPHSLSSKRSDHGINHTDEEKNVIQI